MRGPRSARRDPVRVAREAWPDAPEPRGAAQPPDAPPPAVTGPVPVEPVPVRLETVPVEAEVTEAPAPAAAPARSVAPAWEEDPWRAVTRRDRDPDRADRASRAWATWASATGLQPAVFDAGGEDGVPDPSGTPAPAPASSAVPPGPVDVAVAPSPPGPVDAAVAPSPPAPVASRPAPPPAVRPALDPWWSPRDAAQRRDVADAYAAQRAAVRAQVRREAAIAETVDEEETDVDAWSVALAAAAAPATDERAGDAWRDRAEAVLREPSQLLPVVDVLREVADATNGERRRTAWRSWLRSMTAGIVDPSALEAQDLELALVDAVRAPQSTARLVGVVSGKGGVGASTTAAGIALSLAALRTDRTVLVNAHAGTPPMARWLGAWEAPTLVNATRDPWRYPPVVTEQGLAVVDAAPWWRPDGALDVLGAVQCLGEEHAFTIIDLGNDLSGPAQAALSAVDQAVLVTTAEPDAIAATRVALERVAEAGPGVGTVAVAIVCTSSGSVRRVRRQLRGELSADLARVVVVPRDPALVGGVADLARLRARTRLAYLTLAAMVSDGR